MPSGCREARLGQEVIPVHSRRSWHSDGKKCSCKQMRPARGYSEHSAPAATPSAPFRPYLKLDSSRLAAVARIGLALDRGVPVPQRFPTQSDVVWRNPLRLSSMRTPVLFNNERLTMWLCSYLTQRATTSQLGHSQWHE